MLIDVSIVSNNGQQAKAAVSWFVDNELSTDEVTFDRARDHSGRHRLTHDLPLHYVDEVFGELMEAVMVQHEDNEGLN